jgi:hypothetical protein
MMFSAAYTRVLKLVALQPRLNLIMHCILLPNTTNELTVIIEISAASETLSSLRTPYHVYISFYLLSHLNVLILVFRI